MMEIVLSPDIGTIYKISVTPRIFFINPYFARENCLKPANLFFNMKLFPIPGKLHCPTAAVETQQAEQEGGRGGAEGGAEGGGAVPVHRLARPRHSSQHPRSPQLHQEVLRCHSGN